VVARIEVALSAVVLNAVARIEVDPNVKVAEILFAEGRTSRIGPDPSDAADALHGGHHYVQTAF
jgi:hypothetical protein